MRLGDGRTARCNQIVDEQNHVVRRQGIGVNLERVGAVFERITLAYRFARELPGLARRNEAGVKTTRDRRAHHESPSFGSYHLGNARIFEMVGNRIDHRGESLRIGKKRRDVFEDNPRLGIIGNIDDQTLEIVCGHIVPFCSSLVNAARASCAVHCTTEEYP